MRAVAEEYARCSEPNTEKTGFKQRFFTAFNTSFNTLTGKYVNSLKFLVRLNG